MIRSTGIGLPALLIALLLMAACTKKEDPEIAPAAPLFTITFTGHFVTSQVPVILFLSYPDGTVYLDTTCGQNGTYTLFPPAGKAVPETFSVTIVQPRTYWHSFLVEISTFDGVRGGTAWAMRGSLPDTAGSATVSLKNLPAITGPILYSCTGFYNLTMQSVNRTMTLSENPSDLCIRIATTDGTFYRYDQHLLNDGASLEVDMTGVVAAAEKSVSLPFEAGEYTFLLYGNTENEYDPGSSLLTDYVISDGFPADTVRIHYPPDRFNGYYTEMMISEQFGAGETFHYHTDGAIPSHFSRIDATLAAIQPEKARVSFSASGQFDMTSAQWDFMDKGNIIYTWRCYSRDTTRQLSVPAISPALSRWFPTLRHDSLSLTHVELTDLLTLPTYAALLETLFNPASPSLMNRYDATTVRSTLLRDHSTR